MSERFLAGYAVDMKKLTAMLGSAKLAPKAIRAKAQKGLVTDIDLTLGQGDRKDGKILVDTALTQMATKKLDKELREDHLRAGQLVVDAYGTNLGIAEVPYIESDSFGLLTPVFKALKMPVLAKVYGKTSLAFPFKTAVDDGWPIAMLLEGKVLASCNAELATKWQANVAALPDKLFVDKRHAPSSNPEAIGYARAEFVPALVALGKWCAAAVKAKRALIVYLDGDQ